MAGLRNLPPAFLASILILAAAARADAAPPKLAVLGLEVIDDGSSEPLVKKTTDVAKLLTDRLRAEVSTKGTPYRLTPNSRKDLLELKLLSDCSDEGAACMAEIGREMRTDQMVYGKLERRRQGYWVSLTLFSVSTKSVVRRSEGTVPFREAQPGRIKTHARKLFRTVIGLATGATLIVKVKNSEDGTVYLDGTERGRLTKGTLSIPGLRAGTHALRVVAPGYAAREQRVRLRPDEELALDVVLFDDVLARPSDSDQVGGRRTGSKIAFWSATAATVAAGGLWTFSGLQVLNARDDRDAAVELLSSNQVYVQQKMDLNNDDCDAADALRGSGDVNQGQVDSLLDACDRGKKHSFLATWVAPPATALFAATAIYFGYRAYIKADNAEESSGNESADASVTFEPYAGPDVMGAGMTVRF